MTTYLTSAECNARLGNPSAEKDMVLFDVPSEFEIGVIPKKIYCNKRMVEPLTRAFINLIHTGHVKELRTWDGCFNIRPKRGATTYSLHSWGLAIDVNAAWNRFGEKPTMSPGFVECFTDAGFHWGGEWRKPDGMHFQLAKLV
jgi:hypothetical protein